MNWLLEKIFNINIKTISTRCIICDSIIKHKKNRYKIGCFKCGTTMFLKKPIKTKSDK